MKTLAYLAWFAGAVASSATQDRQAAALASDSTTRELLIRGGRVVNATGVSDADVRIVGETIAEVGPNLSAGTRAHLIDARGRLVMPGGVDPHTHLHPPFVDTLTTGSNAAIAGGITTLGTFAHADDAAALPASIDRLAELIGTEAIADVLLHSSVWPAPSTNLSARFAEFAKQGHRSFKLYMSNRQFDQHIDAAHQAFEAAARFGIVMMVHAEDSTLLAAALGRLEAEGRNSVADYPASRPVIAEIGATQRALAMGESTGATLYFVHLSSARALAACVAARTAGRPVYVETRPLYLHFTEERLRGPDGALYVGQPPLRSAADSEALWRGLADGSIDVLATDHAPWKRNQKLSAQSSIRQLQQRPGLSDLQFMLPMYFSEGVRKRGLPLQRFVATTSTNPARIFGLFPRKGVIRTGADADIVIWDPEVTRTITGDDDLSNSDYTAYEGWQVTGWPVVTIRRGEIVFQDGRIAGRPGSGKLLARERMPPSGSSVDDIRPKAEQARVP